MSEYSYWPVKHHVVRARQDNCMPVKMSYAYIVISVVAGIAVNLAVQQKTTARSWSSVVTGNSGYNIMLSRRTQRGHGGIEAVKYAVGEFQILEFAQAYANTL